MLVLSSSCLPPFIDGRREPGRAIGLAGPPDAAQLGDASAVEVASGAEHVAD
jgi:hypothetical protein